MRDVETVGHELEGDQLISALEERAEMILAQASSSNDASQLHSLIGDARFLLTQVPQGHARAGTAISRISEAIATAEKREMEVENGEEEEAGLEMVGPKSFASRQFQQKLYSFMSQEEKQYFNSIQDNKQYSMAVINEDGSITETEKTVEGAQLKEDVARIKYHTLSEEQREGIKLPEGKTAEEMSPSDEAKELDKLQGALDRIEGKTAQDLLERGASKEECKRCHQHFDQARDQARQLQGRIRRREELKADGRETEASMENAMIQVDRGRLRKTLQKDVIDGEMLGKDNDNHEMAISGGRHVDDGMSNQLTANVSQISDSLRQQGVRGVE